MQTTGWLGARARNLGAVLSRPWLLWLLGGVFWARLAVLTALTPPPPDGEALIGSARLFLQDPRRLYQAEAAFLQAHGVMATHGWSGPPGAMLLVAPFAALPDPLAIRAWMFGDLLAAAGGLALLLAAVRPSGWRRPAFVLAAGYFPPLFADLTAAQLGGYLLLLGGAALWLSGRGRAGWAGALAGLGSGIKLYPAGMLAGIAPRRLPRFTFGLAAAALLLTVAGFARIGFDRVLFYVRGVLLPSLRTPLQDCAIDSPRTLVARTVGGDPYAIIGPGGGLVWVRLPIHEPALAAVLTYLLLAVLVALAVWAAARSGWHPVYGLALGLALGALLPGEVNPYQELPLLPLVLVTGVRAAESGRHRVLLALAIGMVGFVRQPCLLPFPDTWTLAALTLFVTGAWSWRLFRPGA